MFDPNRLCALAEDETTHKLVGLLLVLFVNNLDVLEPLAINPNNHPITDRLLAKHAEPAIRANVARKIGWGALDGQVATSLMKDPDPYVRDVAELSSVGDWNHYLPVDEADPY